MSTYSDYSDYSDESFTGSYEDDSYVTEATFESTEDFDQGSSSKAAGRSAKPLGTNQTKDVPQPAFNGDPYVAPEPKTVPAQQVDDAVKTRSVSRAPARTTKSGKSKSLVGNPVRKCNDVIFLILFMAAWVGMFFVAGFAFDSGDPERIYFPMDSQGNFCGKDNVQEGYEHIDAANRQDFTNNLYLYYPDPTDPTINMCVAACPTTTSTNAACLGLNPTTIASAGALGDGCLCTYATAANPSCYPQYESTAIARRCVPGNLEAEELSLLKDEIDRFNGFYERFFSVSGEDEGKGWKLIAAAFGIAIGLALVFLVIMYLAAPVVVWGTITVGYAALIAGAVWLVIKAREWTDDANEAIPQNENDIRNAEALTVTSWVAVGFVFLLGLIVLFMAKRINIAVGVIRCASKTCGKNPSVFLSPLTSVIIAGAVLAWALFVGAYLYSAGDIVVTNGLREFDHDRELQGVIIYWCFWASWVIFFILGITSLSVAMVASQDYFEVPQPACGTYFGAIGRSFFYHAGSVAFGSLLIAIVFSIRVAFQFLKKQMKGYIQSNPAAKLAVCCIDCCLACFQRFLEFLTTNAFIQIAIHGSTFCKAAKDAWKLIMNNPLRVAAVTGVTTLVLFIGKVFVAALTVVIMQEVLESEGVERNYILLFIIFIFAYVVSYLVFTTYESMIKAILQCFIEDERWNPANNRFAPGYLQKYMLPREKPPKQA